MYLNFQSDSHLYLIPSHRDLVVSNKTLLTIFPKLVEFSFSLKKKKQLQNTLNYLQLPVSLLLLSPVAPSMPRRSTPPPAATPTWACGGTTCCFAAVRPRPRPLPHPRGL